MRAFTVAMPERGAALPYRLKADLATARMELRGLPHSQGLIFDPTMRGSTYVLGRIELRFELGANEACVGFYIHPEFQGKGLATEGVAEILRFAFVDVGLRRVFAQVHTGNRESSHVLQKLCFQLDVAGDAWSVWHLHRDHWDLNRSEVRR